MKRWKQILSGLADRLWRFKEIRRQESEWVKEKAVSSESEIQPEIRLEKIREEEEQEDFMITPPNKYAVTETGQVIRLPERSRKRRELSIQMKEPRL